jgi:hypothetical protein
MSGVGELSRHNFPEVGASQGRGYHCFREPVPISRAGSAPILEVVR